MYMEVDVEVCYVGCCREASSSTDVMYGTFLVKTHDVSDKAPIKDSDLYLVKHK